MCIVLTILVCERNLVSTIPQICESPNPAPICQNVAFYAVMALWCSICCSGLGVSLLFKPGSGILEAILSGTKSGDTERTGYSAAGVARSRRDVVGWGARMVGDVTSSTLVRGMGPLPVRTFEGRICSKPSSRATFSMLLKY